MEFSSTIRKSLGQEQNKKKKNRNEKISLWEDFTDSHFCQMSDNLKRGMLHKKRRY